MQERIELERLTRRVQQYFIRRAARYGLNPPSITSTYLLNWGGFVNASFRISDGAKRYHLKLADYEDQLARLMRWRDLHELLEQRYHAPVMIDWIKIPGVPFEGPLFEHIPDGISDLDAYPNLRRELIDLLALLHTDEDLALRLVEMDGPPGSCLDYFLDTYIDRFDEDLASVLVDLPSFVPIKLFDWMSSETRHLEALARENPAFDRLADSPTHGDLWPNNILVTPGRDWFIIDWDDLSLGDPALEYSIVLANLWRARLPTDVSGVSLLPEDIREDAALRERFTLCLRAYLLDGVIDTLADYVESGFAPEFEEAVKREKKRQHAEALALYQTIYR